LLKENYLKLLRNHAQKIYVCSLRTLRTLYGYATDTTLRRYPVFN